MIEFEEDIIEIQKLFECLEEKVLKIGSDNFFDNSADFSVVLVHQDVLDKEHFLLIMLDNLKKGSKNGN